MKKMVSGSRINRERPSITKRVLRSTEKISIFHFKELELKRKFQHIEHFPLEKTLDKMQEKTTYDESELQSLKSLE